MLFQVFEDKVVENEMRLRTLEQTLLSEHEGLERKLTGLQRELDRKKEDLEADKAALAAEQAKPPQSRKMSLFGR